MATTIGKDSVFALKKATTWGTAVECGANDGLLLDGEGLIWTQEDVPDDAAGQAFLENADLSNETVEGDLAGFMRYELDVPLALAMGIAGTPTDVSGGTTYSNTYKMNTEIEGLFATFAVDKVSYATEIPSVKITGFDITAEGGQPWTIAFHCKGNTRNLDSTNTTTTMNNVTFPSKERVLMSHSVIRMNAQDGDALDGDDRIYPSTFTLSYNRPTTAEYTQNDNTIEEPVDDGQPECNFTMTIPKITGSGYITDFTSENEKKIDIIATGPTITGTAYSNTFTIEIPKAKLMTPATDAVDGPGKTNQELSFRCLRPTTAPSGMTGNTYPFVVKVQNSRGTDPLA